MTGALNVARMRLTMQGSGNSEACLQAKTCLPLGGHSVAAVVPPLRNATGPEVRGCGWVGGWVWEGEGAGEEGCGGSCACEAGLQ